ncbi:MAG: carboxypeptidase regulatory-like domain-containing protein [Phycisphaerae bacterium]|nr:carboxypeptidase regulatory-like domain-containing protein [Gemmatimonadaceae bacterium]
MLAATLSPFATAALQSQEILLRSNAPGRIQGVVFDSLRGVVVKGATVLLVGRPNPDTTDNYGRYELKDVVPGKQVIAFSWPNLDSLGIGTLGQEVVVDAGATVKVNLASPSFRTVWMHHCGNAPRISSDSGIAYGTLRDAATMAPVAGGTVSFSWYNFDITRVAASRVRDVVRESVADKSGAYVACGMPSEVRVTGSGRSPISASGRFDFELNVLRLQRVDVLVSSDMVIPDSVQFASRADSLAAQRPRGLASIRGTVLDYRQKPMANATVWIATVDTVVRTGRNGQFFLSGLPAGTHEMGVRRVGYAPFHTLVHLQPDSVIEVRVPMPDVAMLTTMNVRADFGKSTLRSGYDQRRRLGYGYFFEPRNIPRKGDLGTVLALAPKVTVRRQPDGMMHAVIPGALTQFCPMAVFLDGLPSTWEIIHMRTPDQYRAIEVYPDWRKVPQQWIDVHPQRDPCGSAVFWTYNVKW